MITIDIVGKPIVWKRTGQKRLGKITIRYDRQKKEKEQTRWQIKGQYREDPLTVPLQVDLTFYMPIPKATSGKRRTQMTTGFIHHMKRPDIDNLSKYVMDCMTGIVFNDDAQICELNARKQYSLRPATLVRIHPYTLNVPPELSDEDEDDDYYTQGDYV